MSFKWSQSGSSVTVTFVVAGSTKKADVDVIITATSLKAGLKGGAPVCEGTLFAPIKPNSSKWDLKHPYVSIHLDKASKGNWPNIFNTSGAAQGDSRKRMRATYDYDAQDPIELTIKEGDVITVIKEDPSGWWKGELQGKVGLFPSNFTEELPNTGGSSGGSGSAVPGPAESSPEETNVGAFPEQTSDSAYPASSSSDYSSTSSSAFPTEQPPAAAEGQPPQPTGPRGVMMPGLGNAEQLNELRSKLAGRGGGGPGPKPSGPTPVGGPAPGGPAPGANRPMSVAVKSSGVPAVPLKQSVPGLSKKPSDMGAQPPLPPNVGNKPTRQISRSEDTGANPIPAPGHHNLAQSAPVLKSSSDADDSKSAFKKKLESLGGSGGSFLGGLAPPPASIMPGNLPPPIVNVAPPAEQDEFHKKTPRSTKSQCRVAYEYVAAADGELNLQPGEIINILNKADNGWWQGEIEGRVGWFPATFVEGIESAEGDSGENTTDSENGSFLSEGGSFLGNVDESLADLSSDKPRLSIMRRAAGAGGRKPPSKRSSVSIPRKESNGDVSAPSKSGGSFLQPPKEIDINEVSPTPTPAPAPVVAATPAPAPSALPNKPPLRPVKTPAQPPPAAAAQPPQQQQQQPTPTPAAPAKAAFQRPAPPSASKPNINNNTPVVAAAAVPGPAALKKPSQQTSFGKGKAGTWPSELGDFDEFCQQVASLFEETKKSKPAENSPVFVHQEDGFSLAFCSVDGRTFTCGDDSIHFPLHSVANVFTLVSASSEIGEDRVNSLVGEELASSSNVFSLNASKKPHNPFISAGGFALEASLLQQSNGSVVSRLSRTLHTVSSLAGKHVGCSMPSYLNMLADADQETAIFHYLRSVGTVARSVNRDNLLQLHFQHYSIEMNATTASVCAATLANEGVNPQTEQKCIDSKFAKKAVTLLSNVGGSSTTEDTFISQTGLAGKFSQNGVVLVVIPNVAGLCLYSPTSNESGYSQRAQEFFAKLIQTFPALKNYKL